MSVILFFEGISFWVPVLCEENKWQVNKLLLEKYLSKAEAPSGQGRPKDVDLLNALPWLCQMATTDTHNGPEGSQLRSAFSIIQNSMCCRFHAKCKPSPARSSQFSSSECLRTCHRGQLCLREETLYCSLPCSWTPPLTLGGGPTFIGRHCCASTSI